MDFAGQRQGSSDISSDTTSHPAAGVHVRVVVAAAAASAFATSSLHVGGAGACIRFYSAAHAMLRGQQAASAEAAALTTYAPFTSERARSSQPHKQRYMPRRGKGHSRQTCGTCGHRRAAPAACRP